MIGRNPNVADWLLVGRGEELDLLRQLRSRRPSTSAFLRGTPGVGKSRVAREALKQAAAEGWATLAVRGSAGWTGLPLGPFRAVFGIPEVSAPTHLAELAESVIGELTARRSRKGLLIYADDCQHFDDSSAGLLHQVIASGIAVAIITMRTNTQPPAALTDIWKDGLAERIELQNLSQRETTDLLSAGLGGIVQDSSANRIWQVTSGNPLYLREVVLSSFETGALSEIEGEWRWHGEWAGGSRLQEIVATRLGRLDPDELTAMELLAFAGSLPLGVLTDLTPGGTVQRLEALGLVTIEQAGRRLEVAMVHPLHAEVLHSGMPVLRQRSIRQNLVAALRLAGGRRAADRIRIVCWSIESGLEVDPVTLSLGSDAALFGIGQALAARLGEILPEAAAEQPSASLAVRPDRALAVRLARAAYERTDALIDGVSLANALAWMGATTEAETVLVEISNKAEAVDDRIRVALGLSWLRFWARYDVDEALSVLTAALVDAERSGCDPKLLASLYQELAGIFLNTARPVESLVFAEQGAAAEGVHLSSAVSAPPAAAALAFLGRCKESIELIDRALPAANQKDHPLALAQLLYARVAALSNLGDLEGALALIQSLRDLALSEDLLEAAAIFGVVQGEVLVMQGRPASAGRIFSDAVGLLAERDVFGYRPWALVGLARSRALCGEGKAALAALEESRRTQPIVRIFDLIGHLAAVDIHLLAGRRQAAVEAALAGAAWAREARMVGDEAKCLAAALQIAPNEELSARLDQLGAENESPLVKALAQRARATAASSPEDLLEVGKQFGAMSAWWLAASAAADAAGILDRSGEQRAAAAAARDAARYSEQCEGPLAPVAEVSTGPVRLTKREREVATLAASGSSSKEIAELLYLSPRTVESHLHNVFVKLGITDRAALPGALAPALPSQ